MIAVVKSAQALTRVIAELVNDAGGCVTVDIVVWAGCWCTCPNHSHVQARPARPALWPPLQDGPLYHPAVVILSLGGPAILRFWRKANGEGELLLRGAHQNGSIYPVVSKVLNLPDALPVPALLFSATFHFAPLSICCRP